MKLPRRKFLHLAAGAAALPAVSRIARAQAYPTRPVRIVVPFSAGGTTDILARLMGQWLSERIGQPFIIENRPGAGGDIGTEAVVKASPDGHTLLLMGLDDTTFKFIRDIAPVAGILRGPQVIQVSPSVPAKTIPELIAYAKANPGKLNFASPGNGTLPHVAGELFKMMAGVDMLHVPYRSAAPALTDLLSGHVQVMFLSPVASIEHIRTGKLRALAVTTTARWEGLPDIPSVSDFVPGYETIIWFGVGAPKNTPAEMVEKLNKEINVGLADPKVKAQLAKLGGIGMPMTPVEVGKLISEEGEKRAKIIGAANVKPE